MFGLEMILQIYTIYIQGELLQDNQFSILFGSSPARARRLTLDLHWPGPYLGDFYAHVNQTNLKDSDFELVWDLITHKVHQTNLNDPDYVVNR